MTRIAIIGYGAMGKAIEGLANEHECEVVGVYDVNNPFNAEQAAEFDVAIDFSLPNVAVSNAEKVLSTGKSLVVGTTGWYDRLGEVAGLVERNNAGLLYASNFSLGVQMFFSIARHASSLINHSDAYDAAIHEWHHTKKVDSPSGTALTTAEILLNELDRKTSIDTETQHQKISEAALHVSSTRVGSVVGTHSVLFSSDHDEIEITHKAQSRRGFAIGALKAAVWMNNRKGIYNLQDVVLEVLQGKKA